MTSSVDWHLLTFRGGACILDLHTNLFVRCYTSRHRLIDWRANMVQILDDRQKSDICCIPIGLMLSEATQLGSTERDNIFLITPHWRTEHTAVKYLSFHQTFVWCPFPLFRTRHLLIPGRPPSKADYQTLPSRILPSAPLTTQWERAIRWMLNYCLCIKQGMVFLTKKS